MVNKQREETGNQSVSSFSQNAVRMGGNRVKRSDFKGKHSWTVSSKDIVPKLVDLSSYFGVFGGIFFAVLCLIYLEGLIMRPLGVLSGSVLASSMYLFRDWNKSSSVITYLDDEGKEKVYSNKKRFAYYTFSALGTSLVLASILGLHYAYNKEKLVPYFVVGVIVVYLSRYKSGNVSLFRALDDYLMILFIFGGFCSAILGVLDVSVNPVYGACTLILGFILTPLCLFLREKSLFRNSRKNKWRKFFSLIVVTSGLVVVVGLPIFFTYYSFTYLVMGVVATESLLLLLGGTLLSEGRNLVSLKDIL